MSEEISWDEYNMGIAKAVAKKSKDPSSKVGCYIVDSENVKVSAGFNGFVKKCDETKLSWERPKKYRVVLHAEMNAVIHGKREELKNSKAYVTHGPCEVCLNLLLQAGVKEIIYEDASIIRDRGTEDQKWAIGALIAATGVPVNNINGKSYIEELGVVL